MQQLGFAGQMPKALTAYKDFLNINMTFYLVHKCITNYNCNQRIHSPRFASLYKYY